MADALSRIPSTFHMKVRACTIKGEVNIYLDSTTDALLVSDIKLTEIKKAQDEDHVHTWWLKVLALKAEWIGSTFLTQSLSWRSETVLVRVAKNRYTLSQKTRGSEQSTWRTSWDNYM